MRNSILISISAGLVAGLALVLSANRCQSHRSSPSVAGSATFTQTTSEAPGGAKSPNAAAGAATVAAVGGVSASRIKASPQATASQPSSQPAGALSASRLQSMRRTPQTRPWAAAYMARRPIQAFGSRPSSQSASDTARPMQRRSAQSPLATSYANLWASAGRAKALTQAAASGPSRQPRSLASQTTRVPTRST
jgi:hypothetical protein